MILLDTNVISEYLRPEPDPQVTQWFQEKNGVSLYLSVVTEAELRAGAGRLPMGKRRSTLQQLIDEVLNEDFADRILAFDRAAARAYGDIFNRSMREGKTMSSADCQIASIAETHGLKIATRNTKDFVHCGVEIMNPWSKQ
jgi:toxin FitB